MVRSGGRRIVSYALVVWVALTLNFVLPRAAPGDPIRYLLGDQSSNLSETQRKQVLSRYGLDRGLPEQYGRYLLGVVTGDLGRSVRFGRPVREILLDRLPWTFLLVGTATVLSVGIAVIAGSLVAWRGRSWADVGLTSGALALDATPGFWLGMVLIALFSVGLGWLPSFGATPTSGEGVFVYLFEVGRRLVLPVVTITLATVGSTFLLVRGAVLMTLDEGYVRLARAKGLSEARILHRHGLRNALLPVYTNLMLSLGAVVSGAVVVETVFAYPGLGRLIYEATLARDYPLVQGAFVLVTVGIIGANLVADLTYPLIDPRVRTPPVQQHRT